MCNQIQISMPSLTAPLTVSGCLHEKQKSCPATQFNGPCKYIFNMTHGYQAINGPGSVPMTNGATDEVWRQIGQVFVPLLSFTLPQLWRPWKKRELSKTCLQRGILNLRMHSVSPPSNAEINSHKRPTLLFEFYQQTTVPDSKLSDIFVIIYKISTWTWPQLR
jgi:hypothetical protein